MAAITPMREDATQRQEDDGVRWLAMLLLKAALILANGVRARYSLSRARNTRVVGKRSKALSERGEPVSCRHLSNRRL
jgi:hypothetical protein